MKILDVESDLGFKVSLLNSLLLERKYTSRVFASTCHKEILIPCTLFVVTVLHALNIINHHKYNLKQGWTHGVAAAYRPYLVTFNGTSLTVWNRKSMKASTVQAAKVKKALFVFDTDLATGKFQGSPCLASQ